MASRSSLPANPDRVSTYEILSSTARNVNKLVKSCNAIEKVVKEQALSIAALQHELGQLKSTLKAKQRADYTLKKAGHEVHIKYRKQFNCLIVLIMCTNTCRVR